MHRSGTSVVARGLGALGVYLGNDFLDAQPENPTGYWEDRGIVELNERLLKVLHLTWDSVTPIERVEFSGWRIWRLRREAVRYLRCRFMAAALWGFKDPRTIRLLPFWRRVLRDCRARDAYLLVVRNPASVAASLHARQEMNLATAQRLWLIYMVPFLGELIGKPLLVVDYDLLMLDPARQLERIRDRLGISELDLPSVESFSRGFLDSKLRHTVFSLDEIDTRTKAGRLTKEAYGLLYALAADHREPDTSFWSAWEAVKASFACQDDSGET